MSLVFLVVGDLQVSLLICCIYHILQLSLNSPLTMKDPRDDNNEARKHNAILIEHNFALSICIRIMTDYIFTRNNENGFGPTCICREI